MVITGQNMLEFNGSNLLFQENLGVGFAGNYPGAGFNTQVAGLPGNPVGDGLTFQFLNAAQPSPDRLTLLSAEAGRAFTYSPGSADTTLTAGVTIANTGAGGRALVMGIDLHVGSAALVAEVLSRSFAFFDGSTSVRAPPFRHSRRSCAPSELPQPL